jgi:hypothetical protein
MQTTIDRIQVLQAVRALIDAGQPGPVFFGDARATLGQGRVVHTQDQAVKITITGTTNSHQLDVTTWDGHLPVRYFRAKDDNLTFSFEKRTKTLTVDGTINDSQFTATLHSFRGTPRPG